MTHKGWHVIKPNTINHVIPGIWSGILFLEYGHSIVGHPHVSKVESPNFGIWTVPLLLIGVQVKNQFRLANSIDPDETACYNSLIRIYTVCKGMCFGLICWAEKVKVMVSIHKQKLYNVFIERILSKYKSNSDTVNLHLIEQIIKLDKIVEKLTQYEIDFFLWQI